MTHIIMQILLPLSLALIMLGIGLSSPGAEFTQLKKHRTAILAGCALQIIGLPLLACLFIVLFQLNGAYAVALLLMAACPGGVTSNALTFIFAGVVPVSVALTLLSSAIAPFSMPLITESALGYFLSQTAQQSFALGPVVLKLLLLTLIPLGTGLGIQYLAPHWSQRHGNTCRKFAGIWFMLLIVLMVISHGALLLSMVNEFGAVLLLFSLSAIAMGYLGAKACGLTHRYGLTLAIEVGIQNAGMGLVIAATILNQPHIAMILVAYGVLMQLPMLAFAIWHRYRSVRFA